MNIHTCVYHDWSTKGHGNKRHDCWRGDVRFMAQGKMILRKRKRFKCPHEARAWVDSFKMND